MNYFKVLGLLVVALAALPTASLAQSAYAAKELNLRAGPSTDYPVVAVLPASTAVFVQGCLSDYRWCDVVAGPSRGWVYAGNIVYPYRGANVPVATYGAAIGFGVLAFSVANYWDSHYVGRPWYPQRHLWINRPPPVHYGPGGRPPGYRPPGGHPPRPGFRPPGGHPPPPGARPQGGHRPPPGARPQDGHRPPPGVRPHDGRSPQRVQPGGQHPSKQGDRQRPARDHNQGAR